MTRADEYRDDLERLLGQLSFSSLYETFRAQLFERFAANDLRGGDLLAYVRQIEPLFTPRLRQYLDWVSQDYTKVIDLVNTHYHDLGPDMRRDFEAIRALEQVNAQRWGEYDTQTVEAISRQVREAVINGEDSKALALRFEDHLDGKVVGYSDTLAKTMVKAHGQESKNEKARIAKVFYFAYVGPPVRTSGIPTTLSHRFCIEMFSSKFRTFHVDEIAQMRNGQLEPVARNCGGFRCRHFLEPDPFFKPGSKTVSFIAVPDGNRDVVVGRYQ